MDRVKNPVLTEKTIRLLEKKQYSFDVDLNSNKTEIKRWIEHFFDVKVIAMNSHRPPKKKRYVNSIIEHPIRYKRMIVTLQPRNSIPLFSKK
uniref:Ribosomal protein L23 n=5 Tax=Isoetes TaxID=13838 RepID=A0A9E8S4W9_9TRAC|nr:ribosomal protein L23 [Isoetes nuttallii]YP_010587881.1 ribosomal protein L23 [Isoetes aequinoctialis]YP_010587950.1 ribosomal protein L23 [Isoetes giessii]YP_010588019.1 ribosomal protein L23 [Isoetes transvaalensis]YP_010588088.1 ribosomal protein L23 [Isoetes biafrana]YP_010588157.1 ribosomal protein L23 [Isoetes duriei]AWK92222.1 ribosomal protein L23 [Isoetes nuttallii]WAB46569.1 ribosomal protein L23 [Isoetes aequinoctialis]WAB46638.1 ribosomal protein L23 [Isoetes giessii]WAB4670